MSKCKGCGDDVGRVDGDGYCVVCSPVEWFCEDCPDRVRCEYKCRRPLGDRPGEPEDK